jgi:hypothetical protein
MTPTVQILIKDATNIIDLKKLRNKIAVKGSAEEYPVDALVTLIALLDPTGTPIVNTENLVMDYVAGTVGKKTTYRVIIDDTVALVVGPGYIADVLAEVAGGVRPFKIPCKVQEG